MPEWIVLAIIIVACNLLEVFLSAWPDRKLLLGIGAFAKNPERLGELVGYLRRHRSDWLYGDPAKHPQRVEAALARRASAGSGSFKHIALSIVDVVYLLNAIGKVIELLIIAPVYLPIVHIRRVISRHNHGISGPAQHA